MAFNVSVEELKSFHIIDQELYARLTTELHHNPDEVMQVMSWWLWLEEAGYPSTTEVLRSLSDDAVNSVYNEAITCLRCMESDNLPSEATSDGDLIPITYHSLLDGEVSLAILYENRALILDGLSKILDQVCTQVFENIVRNEVLPNMGFGPALAPTVESTFEVGESSNQASAQTQAQSMSTPVPQLESQESSVLNTQAAQTQAQSRSAPVPQLESRESSVWNTQALSGNPNPHTPAAGMGLFMTFSRGYPVSEEELDTYLFRTYGNVVERINMENPRPGAQAMYAIVTLRSRAIVNNILNGRLRFMFVLKGKHVWVRRFVPKQRPE
ncbi:hypothetical protein AQUCO_02700252v1 [Aquilegia coerulea]|uniref:RRM domain-containing protein n=1 Tax=Aquilegia coerulea TaxID=218851 RepID=A0A2G5D600_AQUCA|nr:hypothetical protein AQUCO_02700252v1 [Aquilegia coerulea]